MKVLFVAWDVQDENVDILSGNITGGSIMIHDICEWVGKYVTAYVYIGKVPMYELQSGNINYICNGLTSEQSHDFQIRHSIIIANFKKALDLIKPDFVSLQGVGDFIFECTKICRERKIPNSITCHLYIGRCQINIGYEKNIKYLKDLFSLDNQNFIAVSTGMKKKILFDYPNIKYERIHVITNGTELETRDRQATKHKDNSKIKSKILLNAGTINYRKNQTQIVKAFSMLPEEIKGKLKIIFCGRDCLDGELQKMINEYGLSECIEYTGLVKPENMIDYYSISDGYIMSSLAEGLSMSAIESMRFGVSQIMFSDSECADDLKDEKVTVFAKDRSDLALSEAIEKWFNTEWDTNYIIKFSQYFNMQRVASDYIEYFYSCLGSDY